MQPQQDEMWIEVLKWMGWTHLRVCENGIWGTKPGFDKPHWTAGCKGDCIAPPLTLDALWECERKIRPEAANKYADELERITTFGANPHWTLDFHLLNASKEQRLLALWRTIRSPH